MTNKDITKIYFRGNEIVALYQGSTLIFKKSGVVPPKPTGVYTVRGTVNPFAGEQSIQLCVNGKQEQFNVNSDNTFEHTFVNVPVTNMGYFTQPCRDKLRTLDLSEFDTSQVTSMTEAFYQCNKLEEINLTNVNTSNVTSMNYMFFNCSGLTSLDVSNFDTSNVTDMSRMFCICSGLTSLDVSNFDTSNVTDIINMFSNCSGLTSLDVSNFDTSNVTNMDSMFSNCKGLTSLDVSNFDTSNVTNMDSMFSNCKGLTSLDVSNFDTSNVTNMGYMFDQCIRLTSIDLSGSETTKLTSIKSMFRECYELKDLYINFDLKLISEYQIEIFISCRSLTNVVGKFNNYKHNLDLSFSPLTEASAMVFINGLATVTEKRRLSLSATTYDSLTPEQIAIATAKGWTVTRR